MKVFGRGPFAQKTGFWWGDKMYSLAKKNFRAQRLSKLLMTLTCPIEEEEHSAGDVRQRISLWIIAG